MSSTSPVKIAVIGSGIIGRTLAGRFAEAGHTVTFGAREPGNPELLDLAGKIGAGVSDIPAAIDASDAVVWAIPGAAMAEAVAEHGSRLDGKIVVDTTNAVGAPVQNSLGPIAQHAPGARAYRAFNSLGWENFADPGYGDIVGDLLYSGPPEGAETVETLIAATGLRPVRVGDNDKAEIVDSLLIAATGLRPVRVGDNDKAEIVDSLAALWFALAFGQGMGRGLGFKILTR
jgi:predicted dinucleotide-binding enzyme